MADGTSSGLPHTIAGLSASGLGTAWPRWQWLAILLYPTLLHQHGAGHADRRLQRITLLRAPPSSPPSLSQRGGLQRHLTTPTAASRRLSTTAAPFFGRYNAPAGHLRAAPWSQAGQSPTFPSPHSRGTNTLGFAQPVRDAPDISSRARGRPSFGVQRFPPGYLSITSAAGSIWAIAVACSIPLMGTL